MKRLKLTELRTDAAVKGAYDGLYPADPSVAYATEVDDSFFVLNGSENRDVDQRFELPLGGVIMAMQGDLPFQNILFGKREGADRYWFQANGYHGDGKTSGQKYVSAPKPTVVTFRSKVAPVIKAEAGMETRLSVVKPWDASTQTITVGFDHAAGAVNFTVGVK